MNSPENSSPLPQPTAFTCTHCGFGWNEPQARCPRCGASQNRAAQPKWGGCAIALYACGFALFGAVGACFSLVGFSGGFEGTPGVWLNPFTFIGLFFLGAALFIIFLLIRGLTRK